MKTKKLKLEVTFVGIFNMIKDSFMNIIISLLKPIVHFIYTKYYNFKKYNIHKQNRIKREWKRRLVFLSLSLLLGTVFALTAGIFSKDIKAENNDTLHKYYTTYYVEPGDSLWMIADSNYELGYDNHTEYINEVISINHLDSADDLLSGDSIIIPYYSYEIK